jgi:hypothetical protein
VRRFVAALILWAVLFATLWLARLAFGLSYRDVSWWTFGYAVGSLTQFGFVAWVYDLRRKGAA